MKKSLLILLLLPIASFCQIKTAGIGRLLLSKSTVEIVDSIRKETDVEEIEDGSIYAPKIKDERVFHTNYYLVSSVPLKDLYLRFYKDTLYEINCDGSEIIEKAMTVKYGAPKAKTETKIIYCRNGLGISHPEEEYKIIKQWGINNRFFSSLQMAKNFDKDCEHYFIHIFSFTDNKISSKIFDIEMKLKKERERKEEEYDKNRFKSF